MDSFHAWFYATIPMADWGWVLSAARVFTLFSIAILVYFIFGLWLKDKRIWQYWLLMTPNILLVFYYLDQLFIRDTTATTAPSVIFFNVAIAMGYFGAFTVVDAVRHMLQTNAALQRKRRRSVLSFWRWRKAKNTIPLDESHQD